MSAAEALKAAREAGIELEVEGDDLVWAADEQPAAAILDLLSRHKAGIVRLLRPATDGWSAEDWQAFFDERAGIAEHDGGFTRLDAEMSAFEDCVDHWLALHPPLANQHGYCLRCGTPVSDQDKASVVVTCVAALRDGCMLVVRSDWKNLRRWDARTALMWLLDSSKRAAP